MKPTISSICAFATVAFLSFSAPLRADEVITLAWPDFNEMEPPVVNLSGKAKHHQGSLQLTETSTGQIGDGFYSTPVTMPDDRSFNAYFAFRMSEPHCTETSQTGGDGLTFTLKPDLSKQGSPGNGIGYFGIADSIAVEFDTFSNPEHNDPAKHHIGINIGGTAPSVAQVEVPYTFNDGRIHHAWIDYDGKNDVMEVRVALTNSRPLAPLLSHKIDLEKQLAAGQHVGFTAATGSCYSNHYVNSLYFHAGSLLRGIDTSIESYAMGAS